MSRLGLCNRRSENVVIHPVIVAKFKLSDIQRKVLFADVVERADHAAFENAPETFNRVRVHSPDNVITASMVDSDVLRKILVQMLVANPLISNQQTDLVRD